MKIPRLRILLGFLLSGGILLLLYWKIPLGEVWAQIRDFRTEFLIIAYFLYFLEYLIPALRFLLIGEISRVPFTLKTTYQATLIAAFGNYILPARTGELVKVFYLHRKFKDQDFTRTMGLGMVFWERTWISLWSFSFC